ncbi:MAG: hypothetical protein KDL87_16975 [Verrucomicrobiae bacterium]|nr:hypothetical protein [Verrucomicrobiae bacterium]
MKQFFLSNWKAKFTSLLLAVAIWYLIDVNLSRPSQIQIPVPGTVSPLPDTSPGSVVPIPLPESRSTPVIPSIAPIPGGASPSN